MATVTTATAEPPGADEAAVRAHASELTELAHRFGITNLRFASPGRVVGHLDDAHDELDLAGFDVAAEDLLGAPVEIFSDRVLVNRNVSPDLVAARPL